MFFRFKKSGERSYIQIVENKRIDGAVRQSVIANLGRTDAASGALASLLASGAKLTDQVLLINALDEDTDGRCRPRRSASAGHCCSARNDWASPMFWAIC
jgi:hypothetical protein